MSLAVGETPGAVTQTGARILVVDDNDDNRYTLTLQLELEGYSNLTTAQDGEEAIAQLDRGCFDLILLDVMMPKVDGYQVLSWLKARPGLHTVPVIMISALNEMDSVIRCIKLGAVDYLSKPFDPVLLRARVGASLEKKRLHDALRAHLARIEEELDAARQLQMAMIPTVFPPAVPERPYEIFASMEPAYEIGGDLYDFFYAADGTLCFFVGDVSGKGIPAALFMARVKSLIRLVTRLTHSAESGVPQPSEIVEIVNQDLAQDNCSMMFVTMFLAMLRPDARTLEYCNAGHPPAYILHDGGVRVLADMRGHALGIRRSSSYRTQRLALQPGSMLYLYSDGITEATNANAELFSEARLEASLGASPDRCSSAIVDGVAMAVREFAAGSPQTDDMTQLAVRIMPG